MFLLLYVRQLDRSTRFRKRHIYDNQWEFYFVDYLFDLTSFTPIATMHFLLQYYNIVITLIALLTCYKGNTLNVFTFVDIIIPQR